MRAYFVYYAPKSKDHKPRLIAMVPTKDRIFQYIMNFTNGTTLEWQAQEWSLASPPDLADAISRLHSGVKAGGVPAREWSIDVPAKVYDNPLSRSQSDSPAAPINKWLNGVCQQFDATDQTVGATIPSQPHDEYLDHLRRRANEMESDSLGSIVLRTEAVGQRDVPKVKPLQGQKQYVRPNGQTYYARQWGEHTDVEVVRKAREIGQSVFLMSPPGTGKTALFEAAFGTDLHTVIGSGGAEESDLLGQWVADPDGTFRWVDGPAVIAAERGEGLFLDEVGLFDSKVLSPLYPLMDGRGELYLTANPDRGVIKAKKGFFIVAATNPKAPGVRMSEAILSRFSIQAVMTTDYVLLEKVIGVNAQMCRIASNLNRKMKEEEISWAPQFRELLAFHELEKTFGTAFAVANLLTGVPEQDMDEVQQAIVGGMGAKYEGAEIV